MSSKEVAYLLFSFIKKTLLNGLFVVENIEIVCYIYAFLQTPKAIETNEDVTLSVWGHLKWGTEGKSARLSPSKARHQLALVVQIFLNFLPHVKDGTVPTAGEYTDTVWLDARTVTVHSHCSAANVQKVIKCSI